MLELADRIEAAEGPSRELDVAIAMHRFPEWRIDRDAFWTDENRDAWCIRRDGRKEVPCNEALPHFSASLDAAMTLVPEGLEWELFAYDAKRDPRFGRFQARIMLEHYEDDPEELGPQGIANGNSAALALCAAALRARGL